MPPAMDLAMMGSTLGPTAVVIRPHWATFSAKAGEVESTPSTPVMAISPGSLSRMWTV